MNNEFVSGFLHEHNHGNATSQYRMMSTKGMFCICIDHEISCLPEVRDQILAGLMEDFDEFKETQGPVLARCMKKQDVKKISDEKIRQELEMKITRIRNSRALKKFSVKTR